MNAEIFVRPHNCKFDKDIVVSSVWNTEKSCAITEHALLIIIRKNIKDLSTDNPRIPELNNTVVSWTCSGCAGKDVCDSRRCNLGDAGLNCV